MCLDFIRSEIVTGARVSMRACFAGDCCVNGMHAAAALAVSATSPTRVVLVVVDVVVGTVPAQYAWRVRVSTKLLRRTNELHSRFVTIPVSVHIVIIDTQDTN